MHGEEFWSRKSTLRLLDFAWESDREASGILADALKVPAAARKTVDGVLAKMLARNKPYQRAHLRDLREPDNDDPDPPSGMVVDNTFPFTRRLPASGRKYAAFRLFKLNRVAFTQLFGPLTWIFFNPEDRVLGKVLGSAGLSPADYAAGVLYVLTGKLGPPGYVTDTVQQQLYDLGTEDLWDRMAPDHRAKALSVMFQALKVTFLQHGLTSIRTPLLRIRREEEAALAPLESLKLMDDVAVHRLLHRWRSLRLSKSSDRWDEYSVKVAVLVLLDGVRGARVKTGYFDRIRDLGDQQAIRNFLAWITLEPLTHYPSAWSQDPSAVVARMRKSAPKLLAQVRQLP